MTYTTQPFLRSDDTAPAVGVAAVSPSDVTQLSTKVRALWVGGAGNLTVTMADGSTATLSAVAAGAIVPIRPTYVNAATTATLIIALY